MNGALIPNTPIAVDFWRLRHCPHSRVFFLSHMHADHTAGLTSSWNAYTIYCSELTRRLVIAKLGVKSDLVVGLPLDESVIINLDEAGKETMTVTLVDANHCPGSVMFIFEGYFGKIFYTGDFRYCERLTTHSAIQGKIFDVLYLDNTYCDPKCVFPSRTQATVNILEIIRSHPDCKVVIGLHNLGKEMLLHTIAVVCQTWIGVDPTRKETLKLLEMPDVFTCEVDKVRIRVVKSLEVTKKNVQFWNSEDPTIAILPTCLYIGSTNPYANVENVFVVPYSDHSSFEELRKFVQNVKARKIIPIVHKHRLSPGETINSRVNMNVFQDLTDSSPSSQYIVPPSVQCFMTGAVQQRTNKRVKAAGKLCSRKSVKIKKPRGVVFPPSQEATEMEEDKCDAEIKELDEKFTAVRGAGITKHSKKQDNTDDDRNLGFISCRCLFGCSHCHSDGELKVDKDSGEKDHYVAQGISGDEINAVASLSIKCCTGDNESQGNSNLDIDSGERDHKAHQIIKVDSSSIEPVLVDSKSAGKLDVNNISGDNDFQDESVVKEITGDEKDSVAFSSIKPGLADCEPGETIKVPYCEDDEPGGAQRSIGDKKDVVASSIRTKDVSDEYKNSPNRNLPIRGHGEDEASAGASPHIITKDVSSNNVIDPAKNLSVKRKYREFNGHNDENNVNSVVEHSSGIKKFNIYTGCSCDFARKVLEDMVKNSALRDK
ncbi:hypothetical protein ACROYT_G002768 [Oculina patagonica]